MFGATYPAEIWREFMEAATPTLPPLDFLAARRGPVAAAAATSTSTAASVSVDATATEPTTPRTHYSRPRPFAQTAGHEHAGDAATAHSEDRPTTKKPPTTTANGAVTLSLEELEALLSCRSTTPPSTSSGIGGRRCPNGRSSRRARPSSGRKSAQRSDVRWRARRRAADERRIDDEARSIGEHADEADKKLYSGTVTSPRELQAMQADIDMLQAAASPTSKTKSSR